ncbi:hypothetical protein [Duganella phyllosphaerae]|uniref:Uncharacterized protein n=1 Tax=Duganella phyllosphaerae TaxID=762836 RepID=A0A1E7X4F6_9BURK|nr:hypothetical protein [Duganella phyllosphaerae]OFA07298.1 hypothetical protein DUPY_14060 [Duganella phyllosphaerae]
MNSLRLTIHTLLVACLLAMFAMLGGCASSTPRMAEVRAFAADAPKLNAYHELTERYRNAYERQQPFLAPTADARERALDASRQQASDDFRRIDDVVQAYMQALGALAGDRQYDLRDPLKVVGTGIKAWSDTGLEDRHVNAFTGLTRIISRAVTAPMQERAVNDLMRDAGEPVQQLLDAMRNLLRLYDRSNDNEQRIVLGMMEMEIAYLDANRDRLLIALTRSLQQEKKAEYRLVGLRHTLARKNLDLIEQRHRALVESLPQP